MTQPFQFSNGQLAYSAEDLLKLCQQFPADGVNYLVREDLEKWLTYIGQEDIAQCAANARQTPLEDRQKLEEFLTKCHSLSSPKTEPLPEAVESQPSSAIEEAPAETVEKTPVETDRPAVVETSAPSLESEPSTASNSTEAKPSFFRAIARLIVNVLYRNQN